MQSLLLANRLLMLLALVIALVWVGLMVAPSKKIEWEASQVAVQPLPKSSFVLSADDYSEIDGPVFALNFNPPSEQLPNIQSYLTYYGKDWRPDANPEQQQMHFALRGVGRDREMKSVSPGSKIYLSFERPTSKAKGIYVFSDRETSFWFEPFLKGEEAEIRVYIKRQDGQLIETPGEHHLFTLPEKELPRFGGGKWLLGDTRVDGSLLARQRARWYGQDLFLADHGGEEYGPQGEKERIQFGSGETNYVVHVGEGDYLIWKEERWHEAVLGEETRGFPLLLLSKIEERMLRFDLWDKEGQRKISVNLVKSAEMWRFPGNQKVRFVGARTRTHSILEFNGERIVVGPDEWLLLDEDKWIKLNTIELINEYVDGKMIGDLFVCEGVQRRDNQQIFAAHVYNPSRSAFQNIELSAQSDEVRLVDPDESDEPPKGSRKPSDESDVDDTFEHELQERLHEGWEPTRDSDDDESKKQLKDRIHNAWGKEKDGSDLKERKQRSGSSIIERSNMIRRELRRGEGRA